MRFGLNILTTFVNYFGTRKVLSSSDSTHLRNIFAHRNTRSRSARLHAANSAARLRKHGSIASAAPSSTGIHNNAAGTGAAHEGKQRGTRYRQATVHALAGEKSLQRCNTAFILQPPMHPQPPGAFIADPSFIVPGFPRLDDRDLPPFVRQKLFFDALDKGRQALLRVEKKRRPKKRDDKADRARKLEQDSKARADAHAARRRAEEDAMRARLREEKWRKAEAVHRRAVMKKFLRSVAERIRKAKEARRLEEEKWRRQAEREAIENERWRREQERLERERLENERREHEAAQSDPLTQLLRLYEDKWGALRGNMVGEGCLRFDVMPWPSLENVGKVEDITDQRIRAFMSHLERFKGVNGRVTFVRSELRRWHPDKFEGRVLNKVIEGDRKNVLQAAVHITRVLNRMLTSTDGE